MSRIHIQERPMSIESLAKMLSSEQNNLWFVMERSGHHPIAVIEDDFARFARMGYKVSCCYFDGTRHRNAFRDVQNHSYIFTE